MTESCEVTKNLPIQVPAGQGECWCCGHNKTCGNDSALGYCNGLDWTPNTNVEVVHAKGSEQ